MNTINLKAAAKINLSLEVLNKRDDGYHNISSIMQSIPFYDNITVSIKLLNHSNSNSIYLSCNHAHLPTNKLNTAYKAAASFLQYSHIENITVNIKIEKNIPMKAGLAGGSSDAAAVILALNKLLGTKYSVETLRLIASQVGSDVPFCISGGTALVEGKGEKITVLPNLPSCYILLVKPTKGISTQKAYKSLDENPLNLKNKYTLELMNALKDGNLKNICKNLYNSFERVTKLQELEVIKKHMLKYNCLGTLMSGSGSTVFAIFDNEYYAQSAQCNLPEIEDNFSETNQLIQFSNLLKIGEN